MNYDLESEDELAELTGDELNSQNEKEDDKDSSSESELSSKESFIVPDGQVSYVGSVDSDCEEEKAE